MSKRPGDPGYAAQWCIHYAYRRKGPQICEAGIDHDQFRPAHKPCFMDAKGRPKPDSDPCENLRPPTSEEIAAHEVWLSDRIEKLGQAMTTIRPWRLKNKGRNHAEVVECPWCKGRLHLSIVAYNNHVHGQCETKDCLSWME